MPMRAFAAALMLLLVGCSTADVQRTCADTQNILQVAQPFLIAAPPEVRIAVMALGAGTYACGTPQYAALREQVIGWLRSKGAKL